MDPLSVRFGPGEAEISRPARVRDVEPKDGNPDLLLVFKVGDTGLGLGDTEACLFGFAVDGRVVFGCDGVETTTKVVMGGRKLQATPIATFEVSEVFQGRQITRLERRPDGGLLSARRVGQPGQRALELLAIELDGTVSVLGTVPTAGRGNLCCADYDFGPDGALYGSLSNDLTLFRRGSDGSLTYEFSARVTGAPFPGNGDFRNPTGMGFLPSGRIVVGSFGDATFGDGAAPFADWREFAGPGTALAADVVAIDEDHLWVYVGLIFGDRRILEVARGGEVKEIALIPAVGGGLYGDMIPSIPGAKVGKPGTLLLAAAQSLWEIKPEDGKISERLGGFTAANGLAYGGDNELYLLDGGDAGVVTIFRIEPKRRRSSVTSLTK